MRAWNRKKKPKHSTKLKYKAWGNSSYYTQSVYVKSRCDTSPENNRFHRVWKCNRITKIIIYGEVKRWQRMTYDSLLGRKIG